LQQEALTAALQQETFRNILVNVVSRYYSTAAKSRHLACSVGAHHNSSVGLAAARFN